MPLNHSEKWWHPCKLALLSTAAFLCSLLSSLDCEFLSIDVGFGPANSIFIGEEDPIGVGLWSFQSPIKPQECLLYSVAKTKSVTFEDESYSTSFLNGDRNWGGARISALLGLIFGIFAVVSIIANKDKYFLVLFSYKT